jgi:hypothetical protein
VPVDQEGYFTELEICKYSNGWDASAHSFLGSLRVS